MAGLNVVFLAKFSPRTSDGNSSLPDGAMCCRFSRLPHILQTTEMWSGQTPFLSSSYREEGKGGGVRTAPDVQLSFEPLVNVYVLFVNYYFLSAVMISLLFGRCQHFDSEQNRALFVCLLACLFFCLFVCLGFFFLHQPIFLTVQWIDDTQLPWSNTQHATPSFFPSLAA